MVWTTALNLWLEAYFLVSKIYGLKLNMLLNMNNDVDSFLNLVAYE